MTPDRQPRAALYIRVSSGQQEDGFSLDTQEQRCRQYAAEHGYQVGDVYREIFTGVELWERPQLTALREAVRCHDVDAVVVYAIDRLARDPVHLGVVLSEAEHAGVVVQFVTEPLDDSPEGQLIRFVRGYAAKVEHLKIVERTQRGRLARARAGRLIATGRPLYGYQWGDEGKTHYLPDPLTAPIVRRIFAAHADGVPLRSISTQLYDDGIPTPNGAGERWSFPALSRILKNPAYCGRAYAWRTKTEKRQGKEVKRPRPTEEQVPLPEGVIPPLIDEATFEAVQERLRLNRERSPRRNQNPEETLLRGGFARCGYCGCALTVKRASRDRHARYQCTKASRGKGLCLSPSMAAASLDAIVWRRVMAILDDETIIEREIARLQHDAGPEADLKALDRAAADVERRQANAARGYAALADDPDAARPLLQELQALSAQRKQLEAEREQVLAQRERRQRAREQMQAVRDWAQTVRTRLQNATYAQRRLALDALDVQVLLYHKDHTPRWDIRTSVPLPEVATVSHPANTW